VIRRIFIAPQKQSINNSLCVPEFVPHITGGEKPEGLRLVNLSVAQTPMSSTAPVFGGDITNVSKSSLLNSKKKFLVGTAKT